MKKLLVNLEYCYGISHLAHEFDFSDVNNMQEMFSGCEIWKQLISEMIRTHPVLPTWKNYLQIVQN